MNEKWSYKQSVVLTKICILLFSAAYFGVIFTCPLLTRRFLYYSCSAAGVYKETWLFNVTIYACAVPIGILLWNLWTGRDFYRGKYPASSDHFLDVLCCSLYLPAFHGL